MLRQAGFEVEGASSGSDALSALEHRPYAAVLADQILPDVPGLELLAVLHRALPDLPFIFCSGFMTQELRADARDLGAFAVLEKPVSMPTLVGIVRAALRWPDPEDPGDLAAGPGHS
jgi:two-component system cell cycle sensor histidine kinase/response regulator CckA